MKTTSLLFAALVAIFTLAPTSEAVCDNLAVFNDCKTRGNSQLSACGFDDWACKCTANNAIQLCYLQCPNDPATQNEGAAYKPATEQSCQLASSQSAAKASATPVPAPAPVASPASVPPAAQPTTTPPPTPSTSVSSQPDSAKSAKSSANSNKMNVMIAAVPPVAAVIIGQFI